MTPTVKQALNSVCVWIDSTPISQTIQGTPWMVPAVQTLHILAIAALMASMLMINLRLTGLAGCDQPLARVSARFSPVTWWALSVLLLSGAVLIVGEPARVLKNNIFQIKMLLVIVAIIFTLIVAVPLKRNSLYWDNRGNAATIIALLSASLWICIIFAGRWIAYF